MVNTRYFTCYNGAGSVGLKLKSGARKDGANKDGAVDTVDQIGPRIP